MTSLAAGDRRALGAPADRAADVQLRGGEGAAGQDEGLQRGQLGVGLVAGLLEPGGLLGQDAQALALAALGDGDVGADVEEVVLDPLQPLAVARRQLALRERHAEVGVELVHGAVGLDPRVGLRDPAHVAQMGLSAVAEAGVDTCQVYGHALACRIPLCVKRALLLLAVVVVAGCGKADVPTGGPVSVTVTQDFGAARLAPDQASRRRTSRRP